MKTVPATGNEINECTSDPPGVALTADFPALPIGCYRLTFQALEEIKLPRYAGSAWRGLLGHALKRAVCVTGKRVCTDCLLYTNCPYPYVFETPPPADSDRMRRYTAAPHPFVLYVPRLEKRCLAKSQSFCLELSLFGRANRFFPYIVHAFQQAGQRGITQAKAKFQLCHIDQLPSDRGETWRRVWAPDSALDTSPPFIPQPSRCPKTATIQLLSPVRLIRNGRLTGAREFIFCSLFRTLLRRIAMLLYFHAGVSTDWDFAALIERSRHVRVTKQDLRWYEWTRYSSRQRSEMQMGGLVGEIHIDGENLAPLWPYLWLGQWTHAGKGTSMGLGRYRITGVASLREEQTGTA